MIIRPIQKNDISQVIAIETQSFDNPYPVDILTFLYEKYQNTFLVMEQGGIILGYIAGIPSWREGHIISLAILPTWRRKGLAKKLVQELCTIMKEQGKKRVKLEVRTSNTAAIKLYESLKFEKQKIIKNYYENNEDAVLMKKHL